MIRIDDPLRRVNDYLYLWVAWRRGANLPPTTGTHSALRRLYAEGEEVDRGSLRVGTGQRLMKRINASIRLRIRQHENEFKLYSQQCDRDAVEGLKRLLAEQPKQAAQLASPGMIHGQGLKPTPDYPIEEMMDLAISQLPSHLRTVIKLTYLGHKTQAQHASDLKVSERTFFYRMNTAKHTIMEEINRHQANKLAN